MYRLIIILFLFTAACKPQPATTEQAVAVVKEEPVAEKDGADVEVPVPTPDADLLTIETGKTQPAELIDFAKKFIGTPYLYGSTDPSKGFDCSGFITHVFNHFNISVPRSSIDFTDVKREIPLDSARPGDLILFTGTDSSAPEVGHMGIIINNNPKEFIHSTSGKAYGVTITPLSNYYMSRFVKVVRIFKQNDNS